MAVRKQPNRCLGPSNDRRLFMSHQLPSGDAQPLTRRLDPPASADEVRRFHPGGTPLLPVLWDQRLIAAQRPPCINFQDEDSYVPGALLSQQRQGKGRVDTTS